MQHVPTEFCLGGGRGGGIRSAQPKGKGATMNRWHPLQEQQPPPQSQHLRPPNPPPPKTQKKADPGGLPGQHGPKMASTHRRTSTPTSPPTEQWQRRDGLGWGVLTVPEAPFPEGTAADLSGRLHPPHNGLGATADAGRPRHSEALHMHMHMGAPRPCEKQSVEYLHSLASSGSHRRSHNVPRCHRRMGSGAPGSSYEVNRMLGMKRCDCMIGGQV